MQKVIALTLVLVLLMNNLQNHQLTIITAGHFLLRLCCLLVWCIFPCSLEAQIKNAYKNKQDIIQWITVNASNIEKIDTELHNISLLCLGEATHGANEVEVFKQMLSQYCIEKQNFKAVLLEIPTFGFAERANQFILGKQDTLNMKGFPKETQDFIRWLRAYNKNNHASIHLAGYDIQYSPSLPRYICAFIKKNAPNFYKQLFQCLQPLYDKKLRRFSNENEMMKKKITLSSQQLEFCLDSLQKCLLIVNSIASSTIRLELQEYCRLLIQSVTDAWTYNSNYRDSCMAMNIIAYHRKLGNKILVWSHLEHITKAPLQMGCYLAQYFNNQMKSMAITFYQGYYTAYDFSKQGFAAFKAYIPFEDSIEWYLHQTGLSNIFFSLDLNTSRSRNNITQDFFSLPLRLRSVGALPSERFPLRDLHQEFDMIGFIDKISPLKDF